MKNTRITTFLYKLGFFISFMLFNFTLLSATEEVIYNLKFKQLSAPHSLPTNEVQKVYQDRDGFIWFATRNGLCQYNGYETTLYKSNLYSPDLLTTNSITCLVDDNNNIWMSTNGGISKLCTKENTFENFTIIDGLQSNEFNGRTCFKDSNNGYMYFGGINGFNVFNPDNIEVSKFKPKVILDRVEVNGVNKKDISNTKLKYNEKNIKIIQ